MLILGFLSVADESTVCRGVMEVVIRSGLDPSVLEVRSLVYSLECWVL